MKLKKAVHYEIYDVDRAKTITRSRVEAKQAQKDGFHVIERQITSSRVLSNVSVATIISIEWK